MVSKKQTRFSAIEWLKRFRKALQEKPYYLRNSWIWCFRQASLPWGVIPIKVQHKNGAKFFLSKDPIDDKILSGIYEYFFELYFPIEVTVPEGQLILDIGAHHGFYTIAALFQYPGIKIISAEPDSTSIKLLNYNIEINKLKDKVNVIPAALGSKNGTGFLINSDGGSWGNYVKASGNGDIAVPIINIKTALGTRIPFLVKCNSEGGEFEILPKMFEENIYPKYILLFVHPNSGDEKKIDEYFAPKQLQSKSYM